jgi:hypothetical protein
MSVIAAEDAGGVVIYDAFTRILEVLRRRRPAAAREATRGLDGNGKISKDMMMSATPRIGARWR